MTNPDNELEDDVKMPSESIQVPDITTNKVQKKSTKQSRIAELQEKAKEQQRLLQEQIKLLEEDDEEDEEEDKEDVVVVEANTKEEEDDGSKDDEDATQNSEAVVVTTKNVAVKNEKYSSIVYNDYEFLWREKSGYIELKLPWLETGYDWTLLVPENILKVKKNKKLIDRAYNMFPIETSVVPEYGRRFFKMYNKDAEMTETDVENCMDEIDRERDKYKDYIVEIYYKFWFDICNKIGLNDNGQEIRDNRSMADEYIILN
jgi:hypothetical protein